MKTLAIVLLAALGVGDGVAAIHPSDACVPVNRRVGAHLESKCFAMAFGGRERTLYIYEPAHKHPPGALVFVLHGGGGSAAGMEWLTQRGFNRLADRDGAVIVYPDGVGKSWNDGRSETSSESAKERVDDIGWFRALPRELAAQYSRRSGESAVVQARQRVVDFCNAGALGRAGSLRRHAGRRGCRLGGR